MNRSWLSRIFHIYGLDIALCSFLCCASIISRFLSLEPIELSGDPLDYWYFVKQWSYNPDFKRFDHHDARFGIHWLLFSVQKLFGEDPQYTYIAPLFASTAVVGLTYTLARMLGSRSAGVLSVALILEFDPFTRASSQIRPSMFSAMYILAATVALICYCRAPEKKRSVPFAFLGVFMVLGYLTKLSNLFFTPPILLVMWQGQKKWKDIALLGGVLVFGFAVESLIHHLVVGGTRMSSTLHRGSGAVTGSWLALTERLQKYATDSWKLVIFSFLASAPAYLALKNRVESRAMVYLPATFLFMVVFGVRNFDPLVPMMPMRPRYMNAAVPHCILVTTLMMRAAIDSLFQQHITRFPPSLLLKKACVASIAVLVLGLHGAWVWDEKHERLGPGHPWNQAARAYSLISDAYARDLPIIGSSDRMTGKGKRRIPRSPPLHWAKKGFIRSDLLLDKKGKLPRFSYQQTGRLSRRDKRMYINKKLSSAAVLAATRSNRACIVTLRRKRRFVSIQGNAWTLPERCRAFPLASKKKSPRAKKKPKTSK